MMIEANGRVAADAMRRAVGTTMRSHPTTASGLRFSWLKGRPYWLLPNDVERAVASAYVYRDLRGRQDARQAHETFLHADYVSDWDLAGGPQIKLTHFDLPDDRTHLCIYWPHLFMDAEGAQWFLRELVTHLPGYEPSSRDLSPLPDDVSFDPLAGYSRLGKFGLFRRGFGSDMPNKGLRVRGITTAANAPFADHRALHRFYAPDEYRRIQENAKAMAPAGPALYARYLAACVMSAQHRLFGELQVETEAYLITFPKRVSLVHEPGQSRHVRPIPGNYLVSPLLCARRDIAGDKAAIGEQILKQIEAFEANQSDLKQWAMMWMASHLRASGYSWIFQLPLGFEALTSGFSYYGEIVSPIRTLGEAEVTNFYGGGPLASPPGINPVFSKFRDRLNLSVTWNRPAIADDIAARYADLIYEELMTGA